MWNAPRKVEHLPRLKINTFGRFAHIEGTSTISKRFGRFIKIIRIYLPSLDTTHLYYKNIMYIVVGNEATFCGWCQIEI